MKRQQSYPAPAVCALLGVLLLPCLSCTYAVAVPRLLPTTSDASPVENARGTDPRALGNDAASGQSVGILVEVPASRPALRFDAPSATTPRLPVSDHQKILVAENARPHQTYSSPELGYSGFDSADFGGGDHGSIGYDGTGDERGGSSEQDYASGGYGIGVYGSSDNDSSDYDTSDYYDTIDFDSSGYDRSEYRSRGTDRLIPSSGGSDSSAAKEREQGIRHGSFGTGGNETSGNGSASGLPRGSESIGNVSGIPESSSHEGAGNGLSISSNSENKTLNGTSAESRANTFNITATNGFARRVDGNESIPLSGFSYEGTYYEPGLHLLVTSRVNRTVMLLQGAANAEAKFVYVSRNQNEKDLFVDVSVNDTSVTSTASAGYELLQNAKGTSAFMVTVRLAFQNRVGSSSFRLTVKSLTLAAPQFTYDGFYIIAGMVIIDTATDTVVSGTEFDGLVIRNSSLSLTDDGTYKGRNVLSLLFQAPIPNPEGWTIQSFIAVLKVVAYAGGFDETIENTRDMLDFDTAACNPLPSALDIHHGWVSEESKCSITVSIPESVAATKADLVIRTNGFKTGSDVVSFSAPRFVVDNSTFESILKVKATGSVSPVLVLNEMMTSIVWDYYGREVVDFNMRYAMLPFQEMNANGYYLSLPNGRYASFEGNFSSLDRDIQVVSFTSSKPDTEFGPLTQASAGFSDTKFTSSAFILLATDLKVAKVAPTGATLSFSFGEASLAVLEPVFGSSQSLYTVRVCIVIDGYSIGNYSEFKSKQLKDDLAFVVSAAQSSTSNATSSGSAFRLERLGSAQGKAGALRAQYATQISAAQVGPNNGGAIVESLFETISNGTLAKKWRLMSSQITLAEEVALLGPGSRRLDSINGKGLSTGRIVGITLVTVIPMLVFCAGIVLFITRQGSSGTNALPMDTDGLFIASDSARLSGAAVNGSMGAEVPKASLKQDF
jgi:hypothetical protein